MQQPPSDSLPCQNESYHVFLRRKAASDTGLTNLEPHQGGTGVRDYGIDSRRSALAASLPTGGHPTLPPTHNLGVAA